MQPSEPNAGPTESNAEEQQFSSDDSVFNQYYIPARIPSPILDVNVQQHFQRPMPPPKNRGTKKTARGEPLPLDTTLSVREREVRSLAFRFPNQSLSSRDLQPQLTDNDPTSDSMEEVDGSDSNDQTDGTQGGQSLPADPNSNDDDEVIPASIEHIKPKRSENLQLPPSPPVDQPWNTKMEQLMHGAIDSMEHEELLSVSEPAQPNPAVAGILYPEHNYAAQPAGQIDFRILKMTKVEKVGENLEITIKIHIYDSGEEVEIKVKNPKVICKIIDSNVQAILEQFRLGKVPSVSPELFQTIFSLLPTPMIVTGKIENNELVE